MKSPDRNMSECKKIYNIKNMKRSMITKYALTRTFYNRQQEASMITVVVNKNKWNLGRKAKGSIFYSK